MYFAFHLHFRIALIALLVAVMSSCSEQGAEGDGGRVQRADRVQNMQEEPIKVVFLGDSHFANQPMDAFFPELRVVNSGINGNTSQHVLDRSSDAVPPNTDKVVIGVGINDLLLGGSVEVFATNMEGLFRTLQKERSNAELIVLSIMPTGDPIYDANIHACNALLRSMCGTFNCEYVDLYEPFLIGSVIDTALVYDGLHLNEAGTKRWVELIRTSLMNKRK